ncbi:MAG: pyridoxamine 5'-phosphate oxidase family protein [Oscillospiraceae bacterium]|jgi:nitroimidazol reductase NimA-like FMN-containing flavoprotein (pyridoxamine 5'-phosphate oxidase superfamily)
MQRTNHIITDLYEVIDVIDACKLCHVAMFDGERPRMFTMNFGFDLDRYSFSFYFLGVHDAEGLKIIEENIPVVFELDGNYQSIDSGDPLIDGYVYSSIRGNGFIEPIEDPEVRLKAMDLITQHQSGKHYTGGAAGIEGIPIYQLFVADLVAKHRAE